MNKEELILTTAKDLLIAAMAKDSKVHLELSRNTNADHLKELGAHLKTLAAEVKAALESL